MIQISFFWTLRGIQLSIKLFAIPIIYRDNGSNEERKRKKESDAPNRVQGLDELKESGIERIEKYVKQKKRRRLRVRGRRRKRNRRRIEECEEHGSVG